MSVEANDVPICLRPGSAGLKFSRVRIGERWSKCRSYMISSREGNHALHHYPDYGATRGEDREDLGVYKTVRAAKDAAREHLYWR